MLAQNFKTAVDLGISEKEVDALIKVLGMLEREELPHHPVPKYSVPTELKAFNLGAWHCGSVGCLGGWAEKIGNLDEFTLSAACISNENLSTLFYPDSAGEITNARMDTVTPAQAAIALRNYLTFGEPRWSEALAG